MSINNQQIISSFAELGNAKNIDRPTLMRMLEDVFKNLIVKTFGTADNFDIIINPTKGDLQIWRYREIVPDNSEKATEHDKITLSKARYIQPDFEVGEKVAEEIQLAVFSRRSIKQALGVLSQKIQEIEESKLYKKYKQLEGELVSAQIYYISKKHIVLYDDKRNEFILPYKETITGEHYKKGQYIRAVIHNVSIYNNKVAITLSRQSPKLLEKLLENEIPEIADKLVTIKKVVRQPGVRSKVAVFSYDDRIDPAGACIGLKGSRIRNIMRQINNEQIDVITYSDNLEVYLSRSLGLKPGMINQIHNTPESVIIDFQPNQIAFAIGSKGQNISLASQLIGKPIKVNDLYIDNFSDTLPQDLLDTLKQHKLHTATILLSLTNQEIIDKTNLDSPTVQQIRSLVEQRMQQKHTATT